MPDKPMLVLIAGPYRSGTDGDPQAMAANLARLEAAAWPVFSTGHLPVIGEWIALPVLRSAGAGPTAPSPTRCSTRPPTACSHTATPCCACPATPPEPTRTSPPPAASACPSTTT